MSNMVEAVAIAMWSTSGGSEQSWHDLEEWSPARKVTLAEASAAIAVVIETLATEAHKEFGWCQECGGPVDWLRARKETLIDTEN